MSRLISVVVAVVTVIVIGGAVGIVLGAAVVLAGPRLLTRLESRGQRRRREALERQAPAASDLVAACLTAGATPVDSARAVAAALGSPISEPMNRLVASLDLGADPVTAWSALAEDDALRSMSRAAAKSMETGAPLASLLAAVADDQRDAARTRAEAMARAAGVRSVAPLAACFLPAFLLIGIVPVVASLALPLLQ
jgi:pilus assembly protein TadC